MKVLIIDDDKFVSAVLEEFLTSRGYKVSVVNRISDLMKNFEMIKGFDCIFLDLMMRSPPGFRQPGEEAGENVFRLIRKSDKKKPVIIITGKELDEIKTDFEKINIPVIQKPFDPRFEDIDRVLRDV